jgi:hypothetical protein
MSDNELARALDETLQNLSPVFNFITDRARIRRNREYHEWTEFTQEYEHQFHSEDVFRSMLISVDFEIYR